MGILRRYGVFLFMVLAMSLVMADGSAFAGVPAKNFSAFTTPTSQQPEYFLRGADGYLHYNYVRNNKRLVDSSSFLTAGKVGGPVAGFYAPPRSHAEAVFCGEDGYIRYVYMQGGWKIETLQGLGKVAGDLSGFFNPASGRPGIFFRGEDGYLRYGYFAGGRWSVDSASFRNMGKVAGAISALYVAKQGAPDVFFHGEDGYVKSYSYQGGWKATYAPFRQGGKITGGISAVFAKQRNHTEFFYRGEDGYLRYFFWTGGRWSFDAATFRRSGYRVGGSVSAVFAKAYNHAEVMFEGEDGYARYVFMRRAWGFDDQTFRKAKVAGTLQALYVPGYRHSALFYEGADTAIHSYSIQQGTWKHEVFTQAVTTTDGYMRLLGQYGFEDPSSVSGGSSGTKSRMASGHNVQINSLLIKITREVKEIEEDLKKKVLVKGRHLIESQIKGKAQSIAKKIVSGVFNAALNKIRDALIKHVMSKPVSLESFYRNFHSLKNGTRVEKITAQATRISTVAALTIGIAAEVAIVPVDTFLSCTGYSGKAKMCCLEKRLSYNLIGLVFTISSIVLQMGVDMTLIQPISSMAATGIAASLASATAGLGSLVQPAAHFLISSALNGAIATGLSIWRAVLFDPLTKPLVKEVTKLTAKILAPLESTGLLCQGPCAADNSPQEQCKDTHSEWDFKKFQKEAEQQNGELRSRKVCLRGFRDNLHVSSKGGRILHGNQEKCEPFEIFTLEYYDFGGLRDNNLVYLKSHQGFYWSATNTGLFSAGATTRGDNERFYIMAIGGSGRGKIRDNEDVAFMSSHQRYVSVGGAGKKIVADRTSRSAWESFHMTPAANSQINACFRTWNGKYALTVPRPGLFVGTATPSQEGTRSLGNCVGDQRFFIERVAPNGALRSGEKIRIRTNHGRYLSAQQTGALMADRKEAGDWEIFTIYKKGAPNGSVIQSGNQINFKTHHGKWLVAERGGGYPIFANRPNVGDWETFIIQLY
ncbi:MAG: hypothetical protein H6727_05160 [Myxococcales bacterium]|nr:hypothetical protein [Myxococcales bacterium]